MSADPSMHTPDPTDVVDFDPSIADVRDVDFDAAPDMEDVPPHALDRSPMTPVADLVTSAMPPALTEAMRAAQPPADAPLELRATSFLDTLKAHQITDDATFLACDDLFTSAKRMLDEIDATFKPIIAAAHKAHVEANAARRKHAEPIEQALAALQRLFLTEKSRREQEAERLRIAAEAKLREEVIEAGAEIAAELESLGDFEGAEAAREQAAATDVRAIAPASTVVTKLVNVSTSGKWKVDESKLALMDTVKAIAAGKAPLEAVAHNLTYLNKRAGADKSALKIPGVTAVFVPNVRVRR